ncbi:hypothetical protein [Clostridium sediminicola]
MGKAKDKAKDKELVELAQEQEVVLIRDKNSHQKGHKVITAV